MAAHSNILAWRIPWTEEPGGPQSMGSKWDHKSCVQLLQLNQGLQIPELSEIQYSYV